LIDRMFKVRLQKIPRSRGGGPGRPSKSVIRRELLSG
jgi:hypothetical protein